MQTERDNMRLTKLTCSYIFLFLFLSLNLPLFAQEIKSDSTKIIEQVTKAESIEAKKIKLPVFGMSFINQSSNTTNLNKINVKDNYKLKVGDKLSAKVYGYDNVDVKLVIDKKGDVAIPQYGPLKIVNQEFGSVKKILKNTLKEVYPNSESMVSFEDISSIEITIAGNIKTPGTYLIGAFSTLIDALRVAKGVQENSSLRNIELTRAGKTQTIDLYEYLRGVKNFNELLMQDGDIINIKSADIKVAIEGVIKKPGIFELKGNEKLKDLLIYSQGLKTTANKNNIILKRIHPVDGIVLDYIDISENIALFDGDHIKIGALAKDEQKVVDIQGEIASPGRYLYNDKLILNDIVKKAEGFTYFADRENIIITRTGIVNGSRVLENIVVNDLKTTLEPFDIITVPKYKNWDSIITVKISGSVVVAGDYTLKKGSSVYDLIQIAQGVCKDSNIQASYIIRSSLKNKQKALKQKLINRLQEKLSASIYGSMFENSDSQESKIKIMNIQNQIKQLQNELESGSVSSGKISLNLTKEYMAENESWKFKLEDGDHLYIPEIKFYIYVEGSVLNPAVFVYNKKDTITDYINRSGGFSENYDKKASYVLKPNGEARKLKLDMQLEPGDTIVVASKITEIRDAE